jgi:hypothetical protein
MIVHEKVVLCAECSATSWLRPEKAGIRLVAQAANVDGQLYVHCCQHCTFTEAYGVVSEGHGVFNPRCLESRHAGASGPLCLGCQVLSDGLRASHKPSEK